VCALAVGLKFKFGFDDALDVVGVHLVGGITGTVLIGLFATSAEGQSTFLPPDAQEGLFYGGGWTQLATQVVVALCAVVFSFVLTALIGFVLKAITGLRLSEDDEVNGIDLAVHGETAYETLGGSRVLTEVN